MANRKFSLQEALSFGWDKLKQNPGLFVAILLIIAAVHFTQNKILDTLKSGNPVLIFALNLAMGFTSIWLQLGFIGILLKIYDGSKAEVGDLFRRAGLIPKYFCSALLYTLVFLLLVLCAAFWVAMPLIFGLNPQKHIILLPYFVGLIILSLQVINWIIEFGFYGYILVDKGAGPIEAFKRSIIITRGVKVDLFLFGLLIIAINLLGAFALFVGLFITLPVTMLATAFIYRKLSDEAQDNIEIQPRL